MLDPAALEAWERKTDIPLAIVTVTSGAERSGCVVGYWARCSIDPPHFLVCISKQNHTFGVAMSAERLALHLIPKASTEIVWLFGSETGDEIDKFAHCEWKPGPGEVPILAACPSYLICHVLDRIDVGDHVALLAAPDHVEVGAEQDAFTQRDASSHGIEPGHPA